ncbi:MAG TPA: peptidylprolyl isomerase [Gemmatimonadaceae bacterium]|nr:peptidylprolyl isomerase [Gemmatimonadaceae bacterium]
MFRRRTAFAALALAVAGCGGLKDALTNHVDTAAKAGGQELTATQLAGLMNDGQMPPRKDLASAVANLWVNYQMLAQAAAQADTFPDTALADQAMWAQIAQRRLQKLEDSILAGAHVSTTPADLEKAYAAGNVLVARHILIAADKNSLKPNQIDSARKVADNVRKQVNAGNFVAMVKKYSGDPGSKETGGEYVWPSAQIPSMVPEFEQGARALKPGDISEPIQTQFGFHIILRETYADAKSRFDTAYVSRERQAAESVFVTTMESKANVQVKEDAPKIVKGIAENLDSYRDNRTVLATARGVDLRAARVANWIAAFPPQMRIRQQLQQAPDSLMPQFVRSLMRNELLLRAADSAKVNLTADELAQIRDSFHSSVRNSMAGLGILPSQLGDSAKGGSDRSALAASRVTAYLQRLVKNEAQFVDISEPVSLALRAKYSGRVNDAGLDKAATLATSLKAKADSAANAAMPPSAVPLPGGPPPAGGGAAGTKKP